MRKLLLAVIIATLILLCIALPGRAQNVVANRPFGQQVVTQTGATAAFDASKSNSFKITLSASVTSSTMTGAEAGQGILTFQVCQPGVGGPFTFAWPAQMAGAIAILATGCTVEIFHFDGVTATNPTTATGGGGGAGTVNPGTAGFLGYYASSSTTISSNSKLDDSITNANGLTYTGIAGIFGKQFNSTAPGAWVAIGTNGTCSGAAIGVTVLCAGDSVSATFQIANGGDSFRSALTSLSTSPVPHGPLVAGTTFPQVVAISRGAQGQPFLEGSISGDPGYGQLDLSISTNVINRLVKANQTASTVYNDQTNTAAAAMKLDMSPATASDALRLPGIAGVAPTVNGAVAYDTTSNNPHMGVNGADAKLVIATITPVDTRCAQWTVTSGHYELGQAAGVCGAGGASALSSLTAAVAGNSINDGDNAQVWNWSLSTAGKTGFKISENTASTATGTPHLFQVSSIASSTARPVQFDFNGNGVDVDLTGLLAPIGTGGIKATLATPAGTNGNMMSWGSGGAFGDSGIAVSNVATSPATQTSGIPTLGNGSKSLAQLTVTSDSGAANAYVVNPTTAIAGLATGAQVRFTTANPNGGSSTINVSSLGVKALTKKGATALVTGDILASAVYDAVYDGTQWECLNCGASGSGGSAGQIDYPVSYQTRVDPLGLSLTSTITVANTVTTTSIVGSAFAGRKAIPAGAMLPYTNGAKTLKVYATGPISTAGTNFTLTLTVSLGGVTLSAITVPTIANLSSAGWELDYYFTVNGLTTANAGGCVKLIGTSSAMLAGCASNATVSGLNFGANQNLDVTVTWGTASASNTITVNQLTAYPVHAL